MERRSLAMLVALSLAMPAGAMGGPAEPTRASSVLPDEPPRFSGQLAMRHVRRLAERIGPRVRATRGERRAARYVARQLESYGYRTRTRTFPVDGGRSRNVVGWWPGAEPYPLIVGGHVDSVPGSPGANDNASGIAVMLEAARVIAGLEPAGLVRFVAFGSEELGADGSHHAGSSAFVRGLGRGGRRELAGMMSVDMVADGRPLLVTTAGIGPDLLARIAANRLRREGVAVARRTTCDCSDNGPFERAGIPAASVWSGDEPDHHQPTDTIENLFRRDLFRSGRALRAFVLSVDDALLARLRRA
ncbi:MAG TPA: M28 family peptidase [Actinomycetota bacterium]